MESLQCEAREDEHSERKTEAAISTASAEYELNENFVYGVLFAGFSLLNVNVIWTTPAATFKPFCPSIDTGCNAIELLKPPTSTFAPADSYCCASCRAAIVARECSLAQVGSRSKHCPQNDARL